MTNISATEAIVVNGLHKKFCRNLRRSMLYGMGDLGRDLLGIRPRASELRRDEFWSLKDVSFRVDRGETLGIVGGNGAGKSTLLRVLAGIYPPDIGSIEIRGRVGALISLGAGFHPHMSGRENIFLNGTILGMTMDQIHRRLEHIIDFAQIGEFIEAPVSTYSTGMRVRLGFAVASQMSPEILLVDEVLSVGDASFRERCINWFDQYRREGGTVIFISHNSQVVEQVCSRVVWLDHGETRLVGSPTEVIQQYETESLLKSRAADRKIYNIPEGGAVDEGVYPITIESVKLSDSEGQVRDSFPFETSFSIDISYCRREELESAFFATEIAVAPGGSQVVHRMSMNVDGIPVQHWPKTGKVCCKIRNPRLTPGKYYIRVGVSANPRSSQFGVKWHIPMRDVAVVIVSTGDIKERYMPGLSAANSVAALAPIFVEHDWLLDGRDLLHAASAAEGDVPDFNLGARP